MILIIIIILLLTLLLTNSDKSKDHINTCPISSTINTEQSGIFSYPIEFFNIQNNLIKKNNKKSLHYYNCTAHLKDYVDYNKLGICASPVSVCPIDLNDIKVTREQMNNWTYKHSLCNLVDQTKKSIEKRVFIFGGSVTGGWSSNGCICDKTITNNCPNIDIDMTQETLICRWGGYFGRWFSSYFDNSNYYVFSGGGDTTSYMANLISIKFKEHDITNLTGNDIIFIDHSVNDGASLWSEGSHEELLPGLDFFIRIIYNHSIPGDWPTIILLEMWPYLDEGRDTNKRPDRIPDALRPTDYYFDYNTAAKAYQIPLWSFRDYVWSNVIESKFDDKSIDLLLSRKNSDRIHPPWIVHLFYADLIAANLMYEFEQCKQHKNKDHILKSKQMYMNKLIPKLTNKDMKSCKEDGEYLLDLTSSSFLKHFKDELSVIIGSYTTNPLNSFLAYEDKPGKSGWIDEIFNNNINYISNITFTFDNHNNRISKHSHLLRVFYLRTYSNGGKADIFLCNKYLTTIVTLWEYRYHRTSETVIYSLKLQSNEFKYCENEEIGSLMISHKYYSDHVSDNQKVKIISVKICEPADEI